MVALSSELIFEENIVETRILRDFILSLSLCFCFLFVCFCPDGFDLQSMPCMTNERVALCAGCGRKIADRYYLLAVDKQWHMRCLKCCECKLNLESELTCFSKDGSIYCKEDYYR